MKKKSLKSLSLQKSNVAQISGGNRNPINKAQHTVTLVACPTTITIVPLTFNPHECTMMSANTKCFICDTLG